MKLRFAMCGLVTVSIGEVAIHLLIPHKFHWKLGRSTEDYDLCAEYYGLGPLMLFVWPGGSTFRESLLNAPCTYCEMRKNDHGPKGKCLFLPNYYKANE